MVCRKNFKTVKCCKANSTCVAVLLLPLQKVTVTLQWPCKIEEEGHAFKKIDAERFAAAAACLKLKVSTIIKTNETMFCVIALVWNMRTLLQKMGLIGPNNQLPRRKGGRHRGRGALHSAFYDHEEGTQLENNRGFAAKTDDQRQSLPLEGDTSKICEAFSLFPQPKSLLTRVIQVATSSNKMRVCYVHLYSLEKLCLVESSLTLLENDSN